MADKRPSRQRRFWLWRVASDADTAVRLREWVRRAVRALRRNWYVWIGLFIWRVIEDRLLERMNRLIDEKMSKLEEVLLEILTWSNENTLGISGVLFVLVVLIIIIHAYLKSGEVDYSLFDSSRDFRILDAAALWVDEWPVTNSEMLSHRAFAIFQRLHGAVERNLITPSKEIRGKFGGLTRWISREALIEYSKSINEKPKFLFPEERD